MKRNQHTPQAGCSFHRWRLHRKDDEWRMFICRDCVATAGVPVDRKREYLSRQMTAFGLFEGVAQHPTGGHCGRRRARRV